MINENWELRIEKWELRNEKWYLDKKIKIELKCQCIIEKDNLN